MKLRKALYDYYHQYKDTEYLCNSFNLISYISDYCSSDFQELYELQVYVKILKQINIIQIIIEKGYNESIDYLKIKYNDLENIDFKDYKMAVFYTLKMFQKDYIDNSIKEQEKLVIRKKNLPPSPIIISNPPPLSLITNKKPKQKKVNNTPKFTSKLIYFIEDSKNKLYHIDPECKDLSNMYSLCYGNQKFLAKYKKNLLCPLCGSSKILDPDFSLTGISVKRLLYLVSISRYFIKTKFLTDIQLIYDKLKNVGPCINVYFNGLIIWYEKNNLFKTLHIKLE